MDSNSKELLYYLNNEPVYKADVEINKFPFEKVYPKPITDLIEELYNKFGFPTEFSATSILMAFATAIGGSIRLQFKEKFTVMANLYCVIVGDPGACKTPPIRLLFHAIEDMQSVRYAEYAKKLEEYNNYEKRGKKEKVDIPPVKKPRLHIDTISDYTLEVLLKRLHENPRGLGIIVDELNGLFENMNRYNSGSDAETYNSLWSGVPVSVNRITADSFYIQPTAVSIFGTIQTAILDKIYSKDKDKNGLAARFLFSFPNDLKPVKWGTEEINKSLLEVYEKAIHEILNLELEVNENGKPNPVIIKFSEEAYNRTLEWRNGNEFYGKLLEDRGCTYYEAFVKMDIYALRFALILHVIYVAVENENEKEVGLRAIENSILLVNYFMKEVIKVHDVVYKKDIRLRMSLKQREIYDMLPPDFHISQMYEKVSKYGFSKDQLKKFVAIKAYFERIERGKYKKTFVELPE